MTTVAEASLPLLKETVVDLLAQENVRVVLFGSRARGDNDAASDVDIGVLPEQGASTEALRSKLTMPRSIIEDLNVPYTVKIVDLSEVSEEFRLEAMKGAVRWKDYH